MDGMAQRDCADGRGVRRCIERCENCDGGAFLDEVSPREETSLAKWRKKCGRRWWLKLTASPRRRWESANCWHDIRFSLDSIYGHRGSSSAPKNAASTDQLRHAKLRNRVAQFTKLTSRECYACMPSFFAYFWPVKTWPYDAEVRCTDGAARMGLWYLNVAGKGNYGCDFWEIFPPLHCNATLHSLVINSIHYFTQYIWNTGLRNSKKFSQNKLNKTYQIMYNLFKIAALGFHT